MYQLYGNRRKVVTVQYTFLLFLVFWFLFALIEFKDLPWISVFHGLSNEVGGIWIWISAPKYVPCKCRTGADYRTPYSNFGPRFAIFKLRLFTLYENPFIYRKLFLTHGHDRSFKFNMRKWNRTSSFSMLHQQFGNWRSIVQHQSQLSLTEKSTHQHFKQLLRSLEIQAKMERTVRKSVRILN